MMLDVITRLSADAGYHLTQQRNSLVDLFNRACKEVYDKLECNRIYREITLVVPGNKIISTPSYVGAIRGMRAHAIDIPFDLHSLGQPRYTSTTWQYKWKNWRDVGESAVHTLPAVIGQLTISAPVVEGAVIIINGDSGDAKRVEERVTISSSPLQTVTLFGLNIENIACFTERTADITIKDQNGNEIAVLYNTDNRTRYKLFDVSQLFWSQDTAAGETLIDVAYKIPLRIYLKDTDSFAAGDDYDNAIYYMAMYLHYKPMTDRKDDAANHRAEAFASMDSIKDSTESEEVKKVSFGRNKFYSLFNNSSAYYPDNKGSSLIR